MAQCPNCGMYEPVHDFACPWHHQNQGKGGNPLALLAAPFVLLSVPFIVVVFPIAALIAALVSMGVYKLLAPLLQETPAFWLTLLLSLIPFLAALNLEKVIERYRLYRIPRHLLRVIGVPWLTAQYVIYLPVLSHGGQMHLTTGQFVSRVLSSPILMAWMIGLGILAHLGGSSFDLNDNRPGSWARFFWPAKSVFAADVPSAARSSLPREPATLRRKLFIASGVAFAIGILTTLLSTDYDSAVLVTLRVGVLGTLVLGAIVWAHHRLTRRSKA